MTLIDASFPEIVRLWGGRGATHADPTGERLGRRADFLRRRFSVRRGAGGRRRVGGRGLLGGLARHRSARRWAPRLGRFFTAKIAFFAEKFAEVCQLCNVR